MKKAHLVMSQYTKNSSEVERMNEKKIRGRNITQDEFQSILLESHRIVKEIKSHHE